jgi:hypothetical protein
MFIVVCHARTGRSGRILPSSKHARQEGPSSFVDRRRRGRESCRDGINTNTHWRQFGRCRIHGMTFPSKANVAWRRRGAKVAWRRRGSAGSSLSRVIVLIRQQMPPPRRQVAGLHHYKILLSSAVRETFEARRWKEKGKKDYGFTLFRVLTQ